MFQTYKLRKYRQLYIQDNDKIEILLLKYADPLTAAYVAPPKTPKNNYLTLKQRIILNYSYFERLKIKLAEGKIWTFDTNESG